MRQSILSPDGKKKRCPKCETYELLSEFPRDNSKKEGIGSYCRACIKQRNKSKWQINKELYADKIRKYRKSEKGIQARKRAINTYAKRYPKKRIAHSAVHKAIKYGILTIQNCARCGISGTQAHHPDYNKVYDVVWLCRIHHKEIHREMGEGLNSK